MKKTLLLLTAILGSNIATSQLKVKAGTNVASLRGELNTTLNNYIADNYDYEETTKSKISFYAGVGYTINFAEKFSITPELLYSQMGANAKEFHRNRRTSYTHNYLSLPIFVEYEIIEKLKIGVGPQFNYLLKATYDINYEIIPVELHGGSLYGPGEETVLHNTMNYGVIAGASYTFVDNLSFEVRYYLGLNNLYNQDKLPRFSNSTTTSTMRNQAFQIGLAYKFN